MADFGRNRSSRDGLTSYCRPCHNQRGKESYTRLYGSTREYHLRRRYGIGQAEVDRMLAEQRGECAVCGKPDPEHIDHDHATGQVRGLLCFNCNQALGNVRDNPTVLRGLISYLTRAQLSRPLAPDESRLERRVIEVMFARHCA
ncbi:MAG TPA: endonuclease VII domain-containing protein [Mycobacteriales bacterium]|nr:endonuclease VII domain-containing protein [Mycobacteriales bacterium]